MRFVTDVAYAGYLWKRLLQHDPLVHSDRTFCDRADSTATLNRRGERESVRPSEGIVLYALTLYLGIYAFAQFVPTLCSDALDAIRYFLVRRTEYRSLG